ncbi:MAG TPA: pyridoxal 5'-phosphate synthase glutaminase subunit PdxT [Candidatus Marinimicrobia bacterium]|nr:pyridoxal 5'-phosphate synthase glutaminase subunit PdxT [Candidatus Neomarinimicrobiota bacterium]
MKIGILGIQGAYHKHAEMLRSLGVEPLIIRYNAQLEEISALIIPGGESTAFSMQLSFRLDFEKVRDFALSHPVFGTCAGMIMLGKGDNDPRVRQLKLMDFTVLRNAYGAQTESFTAELDLTLNGEKSAFHGVFIRAPRIDSLGEKVKVLARHGTEPVMAEQGHFLAASFHPELSGDGRIHRYFIERITT